MNYSTEGAQSQSDSGEEHFPVPAEAVNPIAFSKPICYNNSVNQVLQA